MEIFTSTVAPRYLLIYLFRYLPALCTKCFASVDYYTEMAATSAERVHSGFYADRQLHGSICYIVRTIHKLQSGTIHKVVCISK